MSILLSGRWWEIAQAIVRSPTVGVPRLYTVDLRSAPTERALTEDELERFTVVLFEDHAITGPTPTAALDLGRLDVRTCVEAPDLRTAIDIAVRAFTRAAAAAAVSADLEAIAGSVDEGQEAIELVTRRVSGSAHIRTD